MRVSQVSEDFFAFVTLKTRYNLKIKIGKRLITWPNRSLSFGSMIQMATELLILKSGPYVYTVIMLS